MIAEEQIKNVKALPKSEQTMIYDCLEEEKIKKFLRKKEAQRKADNDKFGSTAILVGGDKIAVEPYE